MQLEEVAVKQRSSPSSLQFRQREQEICKTLQSRMKKVTAHQNFLLLMYNFELTG